jgi:hypothetical protein
VHITRDTTKKLSRYDATVRGFDIVVVSAIFAREIPIWKQAPALCMNAAFAVSNCRRKYPM